MEELLKEVNRLKSIDFRNELNPDNISNILTTAKLASNIIDIKYKDFEIMERMLLFDYHKCGYTMTNEINRDNMDCVADFCLNYANAKFSIEVFVGTCYIIFYDHPCPHSIGNPRDQLISNHIELTTNMAKHADINKIIFNHGDYILTNIYMSDKEDALEKNGFCISEPEKTAYDVLKKLDAKIRFNDLNHSEYIDVKSQQMLELYHQNPPEEYEILPHYLNRVFGNMKNILNVENKFLKELIIKQLEQCAWVKEIN